MGFYLLFLIGKHMIQNVRDMQNDYLQEIESFKEMRTVVKSEFDTLKNWWGEYQAKTSKSIHELYTKYKH